MIWLGAYPVPTRLRQRTQPQTPYVSRVPSGDGFSPYRALSILPANLPFPETLVELAILTRKIPGNYQNPRKIPVKKVREPILHYPVKVYFPGNKSRDKMRPVLMGNV